MKGIITGRGHLGLLLMKTLGKEYNDVLYLLDDIEAVAKRLGYRIEVHKTED